MTDIVPIEEVAPPEPAIERSEPVGPVPVVELQSIGRTFPTEPPVEALVDVNLRVLAGEYLAVVGPSGSGKSTLLNVLGLLDRPTAGAYLLDGLDTSTMSEGRRAALRGKRIGFVFQAFHLLPHRTVEENVMLAELYNRIPRKGRRERAVEALTRVGLEHRLGFEPRRLSGGERQRVAIARALMASPSLLLCDEPTGNLDTRNTESVLELFDALRAQGLTILVITHDTHVSSRADRRVHMVDGRLFAEGEPFDLPTAVVARVPGDTSAFEPGATDVDRGPFAAVSDAPTLVLPTPLFDETSGGDAGFWSGELP